MELGMGAGTGAGAGMGTATGGGTGGNGARGFLWQPQCNRASPRRPADNAARIEPIALRILRRE